MDLRHLRSDPRELASSRRQCNLAFAFWDCSGTPFRHLSLSGVSCCDGCGGSRGASDYTCGRAISDDRGVGSDLRYLGGCNALCIPAWRPAYTYRTRRRRGLSGFGPSVARRFVRCSCCSVPCRVVRNQHSVWRWSTSHNRQRTAGCLGGTYRRLPCGPSFVFLVRSNTGFTTERRFCCSAAL